jgi:hypothetical protein
VKSTDQYFVRKMLVAILARWPEWSQYVKTPPGFRAKGFWFEIPAPNQNLTRGLSIVTDERMLVIGLDDDHDHLQQQKKESLPQFRARVLARINDLIEDKIFAISWRDKEGQLRTSNCFRDESNPFVQTGYTRRIRSWSGKRDQDSIQA